MIIVEGCYKRENTALVNHLLGRFPSLLLAPKPGDFDNGADLIAYLSVILAKCPRHTHLVILDGFPLLTEMARGLAFGSRIALSVSQIATARERLSNHNPLIVYCWKGAQETEQPGDGIPDTAEILKCYEEALDCIGVGEIARYDLREDSTHASLEQKIEEYIG